MSRKDGHVVEKYSFRTFSITWYSETKERYERAGLYRTDNATGQTWYMYCKTVKECDWIAVRDAD